MSIPYHVGAPVHKFPSVANARQHGPQSAEQETVKTTQSLLHNKIVTHKTVTDGAVDGTTFIDECQVSKDRKLTRTIYPRQGEIVTHEYSIEPGKPDSITGCVGVERTTIADADRNTLFTDEWPKEWMQSPG